MTGTLPSGGRDPSEAEPQYDFVKKLGAGGMALVFLARKRLPGGKFREVAFKQILPQFTDDPDRVDKFLDEMAVAASLHHPHIVGVHHWGTYEGTYFLELELVRGLTLLELLKKRASPPAKPGEERYGRLPPVLVALLGAQLADALDYAHNVQAHGVDGYLHRDISPDNVMIVADRGVAKILDYGISKALKGADRQASKTQSAAGKPYYHPPEQWKGDGMDPRTDLYALGTTLSLALCGRQLFERTKNDTFEFVVVKVIQGERPAVAELAPPDAPPALVALLERLVQADKTLRPATAKEVGRAFRAIVRDLATDLDAAREQLATLVTAHYDGGSDTEKQIEPIRMTQDAPAGVPAQSTRRPIDPATRPDRAPSSQPLSQPRSVAQTAVLPAGTTPPVYDAAGPSAPLLTAASTNAPVQPPSAQPSSGSRPLLWLALGASITLLALLATVAGFVFGERALTPGDEATTSAETDTPESSETTGPAQATASEPVIPALPSEPNAPATADRDDTAPSGTAPSSTDEPSEAEATPSPASEHAANDPEGEPERAIGVRRRALPEIHPLAPTTPSTPRPISTDQRASTPTPSHSDLGF